MKKRTWFLLQAFFVAALLAEYSQSQSGHAFAQPVPEGERAENEPDEGHAERESDLSYTLDIDSPEDESLIESFKGISLLERLKEELPDSMTGLERRLSDDLKQARRVLESFGYYDGAVNGSMEQADPIPIRIVFRPGTRYTIGPSVIRRVDGADTTFTKGVPLRLDDIDLTEGAPARADDVLDAVGRVREQFRNSGYPHAQVVATRYVLYRDRRTLNAEIVVDPGEAVRFGNVMVKGNPPVWRRYFDAIKTWKKGRPWNQRRVEDYRAQLVQGGLFQAVDIQPGTETDEEGDRDVVVDATMAPLRTIGGSLRYDTDFGFGVQGFWEHRNLTERGDKLRLEMPLWKDSQKFTANYRLPYFLRDDQNLLMEAAIVNETLDAYNQRSISGGIGLERRLSRRWWGSSWITSEVGDLKDPDESRQSYYLLGFPQTVRYDSTNSLLDATRGIRASLTASPYIGSYDQEFLVLRPRLDFSIYQPVIGEGTFVLAARAAVGGMVGEKSNVVPASIRYYSGGGGSVRGYDYQSIGPRNENNKPLGGASFNELSLEGRIRFNDTWGIVAFVDGGGVYEDTVPQLGKDMQWGAGLGLRIYTMIGPVRVDVAMPLNKRDDDGNFQLYISIGQSF